MKFELFAAALLCLCFSNGCKGTAEVVKSLPPGTQLQSSTFGVKVAPNAADGTPLVLGSHSTIITTAQPENAPNINRFEGNAPFIKVKSTIATGNVGEQLQKAGGPDALKILLPSSVPSVELNRRPTFSGVPDAGLPQPLSGSPPAGSKSTSGPRTPDDVFH